MSRSKYIDIICGAAAVIMVALTVLLLGGGGTLIQSIASEMPYVERLFDTSKVHTIDIVADKADWEEMLATAVSENYISCSVVIDGESYKNVGIRPKGNTSLSSVSSLNSERYSFKIEFDHFDNNTSYFGLDKLCLNNVIQDNTYMKDFLCYQMMAAAGADAPLASFAWITVNGEDWGLYTAVEAVEESFAQRLYGADYGNIYKPDSMSMGGGGRGAQALNIEDTSDSAENAETAPDNGEFAHGERGGFGGGGMGGSEDVLLVYSDDDPASYPNIFDNAVFNNVTDEDEARLIAAIKSMNEGDIESSVDIEEVINYFAVHDFVLNDDSYTGTIIHNYYLCEEDGVLSMIPWDYNLAFGGMGMGGGAKSGATSYVNSPIDSPVSDGDISARPMVAWIFENEAYTEMYHQAMSDFVAEYFESGHFETVIDETVALISPYVEKDPTAFCTYDEFLLGAETLKEFCLLRAESVRLQLDGAIPTTSEGQSEDSSNFVDASHLTVSDMGSMGDAMGGGRGSMGNMGDRSDVEGMTPPDGEMPAMPENAMENITPPDGEMPAIPNGEAPAKPEGEGTDTGKSSQMSFYSSGGLTAVSLSNMGGMTPPDGTAPAMPEGMEGMTPPNGEMPAMPENGMEGMTPPNGTMPTMPENGMENMTPPSDTESAVPAETEESSESSESSENASGETTEQAVPWENQRPNSGGFNPSAFGGFGTGEAAAGVTANTWILLGASIILLAAGLLFAKFYK